MKIIKEIKKGNQIIYFILFLFVISNNIRLINTENSKTTSAELFKDLCPKYTKDKFVNKENFFDDHSNYEDYLKKLDFVNNDFDEKLKALLFTKEDKVKTAITFFLKNFYLFVFIIILFVLTIIIWIVLCCCCCCPCLCCNNQSGKERFCGIKRLSFIFFIILIVGVVIIGIISFIKMSSFGNTTTDSFCSLMRIYLDVINGEEKEFSPKWLGIFGINNKFQSIIDINNEIYANKDKAFVDTSDTKQKSEDYAKLLVQSYEEFKSKRTSNPNPDKGTDTNYVPLFIKTYGPLTTEFSTVNQLSYEYNMTNVRISELLTNIKKSSDGFITNIQVTNLLFEGAIKLLNLLKDEFNTIDTNVTSFFKDFIYNGIQRYINNTVIIFYSIFIVIDIVLLFFLYLFVFHGKSCFKFLSHLIWNFLILFTLILFLIIALINLIGTASSYIGPTIKIALSKEGIDNYIGKDNQANRIFDVCINGKGDLEKYLFDGKLDITESINSYYNFSAQLEDMKSMLDTKNIGDFSSLVAYNFSKSYTKTMNDIGYSTVNDLSEDSPLKILQDFSKLTDANEKNNKQSTCKTKVYDHWNTYYNECGSLYKNVTTAESTDNIGNPTCMYINKWGEVKINERYKNLPSECTDIDFVKKAGEYSKSLNKYSDDSNPILSSLNGEMIKFNEEYKKTTDKLKTAVTAIETVTLPLLNLLKNELGNGNLYSLVNCHFIADNLVVIVVIFKYFGDILVSASICLMLFLIMNLFIISLTVAIIGRKNTFVPKEEKNDFELRGNKLNESIY